MTTTDDAFARQQRLATRLQGLRLRRTGRIDNDRWMLIVGGLLVPLGFVIVLLGWAGASRTVLVFEQVPYLISGGVLGMSMVFAGGFTYFAYWLTILVRENRTGREDLAALLLRLEILLLAQADTHAPARRSVGADRGGSAGGSFVATKTGTMLHRPDCVAVDGRDNLRTVTASTAGLTPCRLCDPLEP